MKIAFIGQKGIPARLGGVERHVEELATRLALLGEQVYVYTRPHYSGARKTYRGVRLIPLGSLHTKHLDTASHVLFATIHALLWGPDVIHYHGVGPALFSWIPRVFRPSIKVVVTFHSIDRTHAKWGLVARLTLRLGEFAACKFPHETIVVSRTLQHYAQNVYSTDAKYIPNGVAIHAHASPKYLKNFGLTPGKYILFVARLVPHKGAHMLMRAFAALTPRGRRGFELAIVGGGSFTDRYVQSLEQLAETDRGITMTGPLHGKMLAALYEHAGFMVHPSSSEGLSLSILEGMAAGKAVLVSDLPENIEAIDEAGETFRNGSVADLKRQIAAVIANPARRAELGELARAHVLRHYLWDDIAEATRTIYERALPGAFARKTFAAVRSK